MSYSHIPEGFQTVSPYFCVENAQGFIEFLQHAFDGVLVYVQREDDGGIMHAQIRIGTSVIELSEPNLPAYPARQFACQLFVADCDKVYNKAIAEGAESIAEPTDMDYGLRAGYVKDKWGNLWYISTQIKDRYSPKYWKLLDE